MTDAELLRSLLGETVPVDGSEDDTLFREVEIVELLVRSGGNLDSAAYEGWRIKMAKYANLVDTAEGSSKRNLGSLYDHAKQQVSHFGTIIGVGETFIGGRTRIGKITRT